MVDSVATLTHQPSGHDTSQKSKSCGHHDGFERGVLYAVLGCGFDLARLVFNFVLSLQRRFLALVGQILKALAHAFCHHADGRLGLLHGFLQGLLEVAAHFGKRGGGLVVVGHGEQPFNSTRVIGDEI